MISATAITHPGNVRIRNEDTIAVPGFVSVGAFPAPVTLQYSTAYGPLLFAVVDGMGGHRGGQEASRQVASHFLDNPTHGVFDALTSANRALYDKMQRSPDLLGMGATIAGVLVDGTTATVFNVGDARVYQFAADYLMLLSIDDRADPSSHAVTQSLGGADRPTDIVPHITELTLRSQDKLLLCSDGLSEVVPFDTIQSCLTEQHVVDAVDHLLQLTLASGAPDNVSIVMVEYLG